MRVGPRCKGSKAERADLRCAKLRGGTTKPGTLMFSASIATSKRPMPEITTRGPGCARTLSGSSDPGCKKSRIAVARDIRAMLCSGSNASKYAEFAATGGDAVQLVPVTRRGKPDQASNWRSNEKSGCRKSEAIGGGSMRAGNLSDGDISTYMRSDIDDAGLMWAELLGVGVEPECKWFDVSAKNLRHAKLCSRSKDPGCKEFSTEAAALEHAVLRNNMIMPTCARSIVSKENPEHAMPKTAKGRPKCARLRRASGSLVCTRSVTNSDTSNLLDPVTSSVALDRAELRNAVRGLGWRKSETDDKDKGWVRLRDGVAAPK